MFTVKVIYSDTNQTEQYWNTDCVHVMFDENKKKYIFFQMHPTGLHINLIHGNVYIMNSSGKTVGTHYLPLES